MQSRVQNEQEQALMSVYGALVVSCPTLPGFPFRWADFAMQSALCRYTMHTSIGQLYRTRYAAANATQGQGSIHAP
jgi:hypothetical protein